MLSKMVRVGTIFFLFNARSGPKKFRARAQKKTHKEKKTHTETQQKYNRKFSGKFRHPEAIFFLEKTVGFQPKHAAIGISRIRSFCGGGYTEKPAKI